MKIVVLDGFTLNPGDLSWSGLEQLGSVTVYDRTPKEEIIARIGDADAILTNKTPISAETLAACPRVKYIGVLATGYNVVDTAAAKERGKWAIGVDTDQYNTLVDQQDVLLTSCLKRMDRAVNQVVSAALDNQFWGGTRYVGNLANHGVGLAPYHDFENKISERLQKEIVDLQRRILDGTISTGWEAKPLAKPKKKAKAEAQD